MKEKLILLHKALVIGRFVKIFFIFFLFFFKDYYKYLMKHVISSARDRWSKYLTKAPTTSDCTDNSWMGQSCRNVRSFLEHSQVWLVMPGHHQSQDIGWFYKRKIMNITENIKVVS